jgi:hypothetical protein
MQSKAPTHAACAAGLDGLAVQGFMTAPRIDSKRLVMSQY